MSYSTDSKAKFDNLQMMLNKANKKQISINANGGNSILFTYNPADEIVYIQRATELFAAVALFIDVSKLFVEYIDSVGGIGEFTEYYNNYQATPEIVFKSTGEETDLFDIIINEIIAADQNDKIPFLVRTGCLYGTGIDNQNIVEHKAIIQLKNPLVVFYPATVNNNGVSFLNFKTASKYRCIVI